MAAMLVFPRVRRLLHKKSTHFPQGKLLFEKTNMVTLTVYTDVDSVAWLTKHGVISDYSSQN